MIPIPDDFRYLPHPSQAKDPHPKSKCPVCGAGNDRAIHALAWNRKHGFWWPEGARIDGEAAP